MQHRDLELIRTVHDYRLITTVQFLQLFSDESRDGIYRRLQKLFHHGYLDRIGTNPNAPLVYAVGRRGAEVLEVRVRKDVGGCYLAHQLMIGDFRIALVGAAKARGFELTWRALPLNLAVQPDGFFALRFPDRPDGANRAFFCLEADRSTMPVGRFVKKLLRYQDWYLAGGHTAAIGIKSFRVLTVTKSDARLRSLLAAAAGEPRLEPRRAACWFASLSGLAEGSVAAVWRTPAAPERLQSIVPGV